MRPLILISALAALIAAAASAAPTAGAAPATPQSWMNATCGSITSLQAGVKAIEHATTPSRTSALVAMKSIGASTDALIATTSKAMPKTPHGAAIALSLHTAASGLRRSLSARQAVLGKVGPTRVAAETAKTATALHALGAKLGAVFVHVDLRYSSPVLDATIDQTPSCELVHG